MTQASCQRPDVLWAFSVGTLIGVTLNVWFNIVAAPPAIDGHLWLARLQEPGIQTGEWIARVLQPIVGYPWNVRSAIIWE